MKDITKFLVYCIEIYKFKYKLSGKEVMQLFVQHEIMEYIINCYGALHTTGPQYIIEDINSLITEKSQSV